MTKYKNHSKRDYYEEITNRIVEAFEAGKIPWEQPWVCVPHANLVSGHCYNGINILLLWISASKRNFSKPLWLTYRQTTELGGNVRKGEKGTSIVFWKPISVVDKEKTTDEQTVQKTIPYLKIYTVFNVDQTERIDPSFIEEHLPKMSAAGEPVVEADELIRSSGADIQHGEGASYDRLSDVVIMPPVDSFVDWGAYYSIVFHELGHWTGHRNRCSRDLTGRFGSPSYAMEELIAELTSAFICGTLSIVGKLQHTAYIGSWIKALKNDNRAIFRASSEARKAAQFLCPSPSC